MTTGGREWKTDRRRATGGAEGLLTDQYTTEIRRELPGTDVTVRWEATPRRNGTITDVPAVTGNSLE